MENHSHKNDSSRHHGTGNEHKFIDPVCGMSTDDENSFMRHKHNGKAYYFCSKSCMDKFRADPKRYTHAAPSEKVKPQPGAEAGRLYICPMDPEVEQYGPGICPKCGMALGPAAPANTEGRSEYLCPMHPEVVQDQSGRCPKCGRRSSPGLFRSMRKMKTLNMRICAAPFPL